MLITYICIGAGVLAGIAIVLITIVFVRKRNQRSEEDKIQEQEERVRLLQDRARGKLMNHAIKSGIVLPPKQYDLSPINGDLIV